MKILLKLLLTAVAVFVLANILPGVVVDGYMSALIVALVLGVLRLIVKPILVVLTLPITILTLGVFLLFINAFIILLADYFVDGFSVKNIWYGILFSILLSVFQSILFTFLKSDKRS